MITKEAIEALREAYSKYGQTGDLRTTPPSFECAEAILTAAFAAMPGPAVRVKPLEWEQTLGTYRGSERRDQWRAKTLWGDFVIWHYQMIDDEAKRGPKFTVGSHMTPFHPMEFEFDALEAAKASAQADYEARILSALTPAPDLASENERLRAALEKVVDWASRRCPADDESVPCPLCGARADIPGDFCKSVESIFPRDLLRDTKAALERT